MTDARHPPERRGPRDVKRIAHMQNYEDYLRYELALAPSTVGAYLETVRHFLDYLVGTDCGLTDCTVTDVEGFVLSRQTRAIDPRTLAKQVSALRSFLGFEVLEGRLKSNPALLVALPKIGVRLPRAPDPEDIDLILDGCNTTDACGLRDRTLYGVMFGSGLRESEATGALLSHLSLEHGELSIIGKGSKERRVPLSGHSLRDLRAYLATARSRLLGNKESPYIFVSRRGTRMARATVWKNWRQLCARAGVPSTVHGLRHAFATALINGGANVIEVKELLGHSSVETTAIYTHVSNDRLRKQHEQFHPRGKKGNEW